MEKKRSLWDRVKENMNVSMDSFYNPLNLKMGSLLTIDAGYEISKKNLMVNKIEIVTLSLNDQIFEMCDVYFRDEPTLKLRLAPSESQTDTVEATLLKSFDRIAYDGDLVDNVLKNAEMDIFDIYGDDDKVKESFYRFSDEDGYSAQVKVMADKNDDLKLKRKEIQSREMSFWVYVKEVDNTKDEYLFIEIDGDDGEISLSKGEVVPVSSITVL